MTTLLILSSRLLCITQNEKMEIRNVEEMILRQQNGQLSEEENRNLREWFDSSDENRKIYFDYCGILKTQAIIKDAKMFEPDRQSAWKRMNSRIHASRQSHIWRPIINYAAVAIVAFLLGFWMLQGLFPQDLSNPVSIEIPSGSKSRIILPDGTAVWLNSGTKLSYNGSFGKEDRVVYMEGEGYFSVTKNKKLPFIIVSGKARIRVLGTKFNMKSYAADDQARITLLEGSLQVNAANTSQQIVIKPNQQAVVTKGKLNIEVHEVKARDYILWTVAKKENATTIAATPDKQLPEMKVPSASMRSTLLFDEESLSQIARDLSRAFNVDIRLANSDIASRVYYGDFRNDETLYNILDVITSMGDIRYEIKDNVIWITK